MSGKPVVTRFAPSPTGALHVGGARTALFNWAFARRHGGRFILRIEDTDQARSSDDAVNHIIRDLKWLGIEWDEGPISDVAAGSDPVSCQVGDRGPYFQSLRLDDYNSQIERLLASGRAFVPADEPEIVRCRMGQDVGFNDAVYGHIQVKAEQLEDFVIRKRDGFPTFHLAVVVDDALMGVTHVIRGQEHLSNTPKHVALQDALGFERPIYAHTPSILNPNGSKMSKRNKAKVARKAAKDWLAATRRNPSDPIESEAAMALARKSKIDDESLNLFLDGKTDGIEIAESLAAPSALGIDLPEIDVADFRRSGYMPEAICNYIALLGWNPGNDIEKFDMDFLCRQFNLERIGKANPQFDREKLCAFSGDVIAALPTDEWRTRMGEHFRSHHHLFVGLTANSDDFTLFADVYQQRSQRLGDAANLGKFFVLDDQSIAYEGKAKKILTKNNGEGIQILRELQAKLADCPWSVDAIHAAIESYAQGQELKMGKVAQPLRVAVSGGMVSPPIDQTHMILGQAATLARIAHCLRRVPLEA